MVRSSEQSCKPSKAAVFYPLEKNRCNEIGSGILEFSPSKAGRDITPANLHFTNHDSNCFGYMTPLNGKIRIFKLQQVTFNSY